MTEKYFSIVNYLPFFRVHTVLLLYEWDQEMNEKRYPHRKQDIAVSVKEFIEKQPVKKTIITKDKNLII